MLFLYILRSEKTNGLYIGLTANVKNRLEVHNSGGAIYTKEDRPWKLVCYSAFYDKTVARSYKKCLKSGSGRAFIQKHFDSKE